MGRLRPLQCYEHTKSHRARLSRMQRERESSQLLLFHNTNCDSVHGNGGNNGQKIFSVSYLGLVALPVVFLKPKLVLNSGPNQLLNGNFPDGKIFHFTCNFNCREYRCHILV